MSNIFNRELVYRIFSVLVFIPVVIMPLLFSNYLSVIIFLLFTSIILIEINNMKMKVSKTYIFDIYSLVVIVSFFLFLFLLINSISIESTLLLIIIIWLFDTFSYLGGKIIGGVKLMPRISSGKTVSGLITGVLMTLLFFAVFSIFFDSDKFSITFVMLILLLSFIGDTLVSLLKRYASIKDSGNIMPGHGGLLDRFDSFIIVFFIVGISNLII